MNFTSRDIRGNTSLLNFLDDHVESVGTVILDDSLYNEYDVDSVISLIRHKIETHGPNSRRYVPMWENHIKILKGLGK